MKVFLDSVDTGLSFFFKNYTATQPINLKSLPTYIFFGLRPSCETKSFIDDNNDESFKSFSGYAILYLFALPVIIRAYLIPPITVPTLYAML